MKLTKADIKHKAQKIAIALVSRPVDNPGDKVNQLTKDLICTMGIKRANKTRLQIWRELKQIERNLIMAHNITRCVGRKLKEE